MDCTNNSIGLQAVRYEVRRWPYTENDGLDETFIPSVGLAYNSESGVHKSHPKWGAAPSQSITLPPDITEKVKRVAELELMLDQEKQLLAASLESFFKRTNTVDFQPAGYSISRKPIQGPRIFASIDKLPFQWRQKGEELGKKIILLTNPIQYENCWLVVRKVEKTAAGVLNIECGTLIADIDALYDSDSISANVSSIQSIAIDKDIQFSSCKIVPLTISFLNDMDETLKELMTRYEQEILKIGDEVNERDQILKIEELRSQIQSRLAVISDRIRGPQIFQ